MSSKVFHDKDYQCFDLFTTGTPIINCPGISYLGASAHMTCNTSVPYTTLQYSRQSGGVFPQCVASSLRCSQEPGYVARTDNNTHTDMKILKVQPTHAGFWTCVVAGSNSEASCYLFITSELNTNNFLIYKPKLMSFG